MKNTECDFDSWFDMLCLAIEEAIGVEFKDMDAVRVD